MRHDAAHDGGAHETGGHMARVAAARVGKHGIQILTMGQMAGRLAGGFLAPIESECLRDAVREALPETDLGELESIKTLPRYGLGRRQHAG
jgi:hypothetical protein